MLIISALIALIWANSPWAESYHHLFHTGFIIGFEDLNLNYSLHHWINDALMAMFFFVVGLEIKREVLVGELSSIKKSVVPIAAAAGGMIFPAAVYLLWNAGGPGQGGWGVPMATDIAFALGILALLGNRVPPALTVFLAALAIVDDIGAVLVIAFFYTEQLNVWALLTGGGLLALMFLMNILKVRSAWPYAIVGLGLWLAVFLSGIHATIAGVLGAFAIPSKALINSRDFLDEAKYLLKQFSEKGPIGKSTHPSSDQRAAVGALENTCESVDTPLDRLEETLLPIVTFIILPLFALANAGVHLEGDVMEALLAPVTLGIVAGLVIGKQLGIMLFTWVAVKFGAEMPEGSTWRMIYGVSWMAGIGFTMALFIAGLAFDTPEQLNQAKAGVLLASLIAGVVGYLLLRMSPPVAEPEAGVDAQLGEDEESLRED